MTSPLAEIVQLARPVREQYPGRPIETGSDWRCARLAELDELIEAGKGDNRGDDTTAAE